MSSLVVRTFSLTLTATPFGKVVPFFFSPFSRQCMVEASSWQHLCTALPSRVGSRSLWFEPSILGTYFVDCECPRHVNLGWYLIDIANLTKSIVQFPMQLHHIAIL